MPKTLVEFGLAGDLKIGQFPHIPIRWMLQGALQSALGFTAADAIEIRDLDGKVPDGWTPSEEIDITAVRFVKSAAIGLCWPDDLGCPSLRACRHDVVEYGEGVYDALIRLYGPLGKVSKLQKEIGPLGSKLIKDMNREAGEVFGRDVETEKDFTKGREPVSIAG